MHQAQPHACVLWQVHLTWLDLSFNQLQEVEGLATLTRLQDLALHRNELKTIDGLAESPSLHTLSLGVASWAAANSACMPCSSQHPAALPAGTGLSLPTAGSLSTALRAHYHQRPARCSSVPISRATQGEACS